MITLRQLNYFCAVAEELHFGRAADKSCVTQPALSMQVKELEHAIGVPLIDREGGKLQLTPTGMTVHKQSNNILRAVRELESLTQTASASLFENFSLGIISTLAPYLLTQTIGVLRDKYQHSGIRVSEGTTNSLISELTRGSLDAAIVSLPVHVQGIQTKELFSEPLLLVRQQQTDSLSDVVEEGALHEDPLFVLQGDHCLSERVRFYCKEVGIEGPREYSGSSLTTLTQLVACGCGMTLLPEIAVASEQARAKIDVLAFEQNQPERVVGIAWRNSSLRSDEIDELSELIVERYDVAKHASNDTALESC